MNLQFIARLLEAQVTTWIFPLVSEICVYGEWGEHAVLWEMPLTYGVCTNSM